MSSLPLTQQFYSHTYDHINALNCVSAIYSQLFSMTLCEPPVVKLKEVNSTNEMTEALAKSFNSLEKILTVQISKWTIGVVYLQNISCIFILIVH